MDRVYLNLYPNIDFSFADNNTWYIAIRINFYQRPNKLNYLKWMIKHFSNTCIRYKKPERWHSGHIFRVRPVNKVNYKLN